MFLPVREINLGTYILNQVFVFALQLNMLRVTVPHGLAVTPPTQA